MANVHIEGLDALLKQLDGLTTKGVANDIGDAVRAAADVVRDAIKAEAPKPGDGAHPYSTGELRDAIVSGGFKKRAGKPIAAFARVDGKKTKPSNVGALVEFGSHGGKQKPNPFFSRGWAKSKGQAESIVSDGVKTAIDKAIK